MPLIEYRMNTKVSYMTSMQIQPTRKCAHFQGSLKGILSMFAAFLISACNQSDPSMASVISKLHTTDLTGVPVAVALGMPATTYVCVLEPYGSRVREDGKFADEINNYLAKQDFRGDEGHWTLIYGSAGNWTIEQVRRRKVELTPLRTEKGRRADAACAQSTAMQLIKPISDEVTFTTKEKQ